MVGEFDVIIPLAAIVGAPACKVNPVLSRMINYDAIRFMVDKLSPRQRVLFPTTNSGYGVGEADGFCTEETPLRPISQYGRDKVEIEKYLLDKGTAVTFRLATVFGMSPRMRLDLLVNHFTYAAATDGYIVIFEKDFKRNFIHIRDVAGAFVHALENFAAMAGRPYNVGLDDANLSKAELALRIREHVPRFHVQFSELGSDPDKRNYIVSNKRLAEAGFTARRSLDDGIRELLVGYRLMNRWPFGNV
jgi:nucleoside-diphosphate-sugar epimerase